MSRLGLFQDAVAADKAWMAEVVAVFGERDAGLARCSGRAKGVTGSRLRELYDQQVRTRDAYKAKRVS